MAVEIYAPVLSGSPSDNISIVITTGDSGLDLTTSSSPTIYVQKPDGSQTTWTAIFGAGTPSAITASHTFAVGDVDVVGNYGLVVKFTLGGNTYYTEPTLLIVRPSFGDPL